jgi:hypothetical protein
MRFLLNGGLGVLAVLSATACTMSPPPGSSAVLPAQVLPADARALVYGRTVSEVIQSQELRAKIPALFGADWMPASQGREAPPANASTIVDAGLRALQSVGNAYP